LFNLLIADFLYIYKSRNSRAASPRKGKTIKNGLDVFEKERNATKWYIKFYIYVKHWFRKVKIYAGEKLTFQNNKNKILSTIYLRRRAQHES